MMRLLVTATLVAISASYASAQSRQTTLNDLLKRYADAQSYSQTVSVNYRETARGTQSGFGLVVDMKYQRPNKLSLKITGPITGEIMAVSDGKSMLVYRSKTGLFNRLPAPASIAEFAKAMLQFGISGEADVYHFLQRPPASAFQNVRKGSDALVNGAACTVLLAQMPSKNLIQGYTARVKLFLDKTSGFLRKSEIAFTGVPRRVSVRTKLKGKPAIAEGTMKTDRLIVNTVLKLDANPRLSDADFAYSPPKGAVEQTLDKYLPKKP